MPVDAAVAGQFAEHFGVVVVVVVVAAAAELQLVAPHCVELATALVAAAHVFVHFDEFAAGLVVVGGV